MPDGMLSCVFRVIRDRRTTCDNLTRLMPKFMEPIIVYPRICLAVVVAAFITGCNSDSRSTKTLRATCVVTVVGDESASVVCDRLEKHGIQTETTLDSQSASDLVIVVQDSTVGPLPIHSQIAKSLERRPSQEYLWIFTNTSMVDDQELLELEELECREIFNSQGLPGDEVPFAFDSPNALVRMDFPCPRGWDAIVAYVLSQRR